MANLLPKNRIGSPMRRRPRREPGPIQGAATLEADAMQGLGQTVENESAKIYERHARKTTASEMAQYESNKLNLLNEWELGKKEHDIVDTDGSQFKEWAEKNKGKLFDHFTFKPAREMAENDWTLSREQARISSASEDIKRKAMQDDSARLLQMQEATEYPTTPTDGMVAERIQSIRTLTETGKEEGLPSFSNDAVNQKREEELIKAAMLPYLNAEADADPDIYDDANDLLKEAYGDDLPKEYLFSTKEIQEYKDDHKARQKRLKADAEAAEDERRAALVESVLTPQNLDMSTLEFENVLAQTQGLTNKDMIDLKRVWMSGKAIYDDTGVDPWTTTQNPALYYETVKAIQDGEPMTKAELEDLWLHNDTMQWNVNAQISLRSALSSRGAVDGKFKTSDPGVKNFLDQWDAQYEKKEDGKTIVPVDDFEDWDRGRRNLVNKLEEAYPDSGAMRRVYEEHIETTKTPSRISDLLDWFGRTPTADYRPGPNPPLKQSQMIQRGAVPLVNPKNDKVQLLLTPRDITEALRTGWDHPVPKNNAEFEEHVRLLYRSHPEEAQKYYDTYAGGF